jgi:hypothetical protein
MRRGGGGLPCAVKRLAGPPRQAGRSVPGAGTAAGDGALEAALDVAQALALGGPPSGVGLGLGVVAQPHQHHGVQGAVELVVPATVEAMAVTCPDAAGIGLVPARAANAASERNRPGCDQLTSSWAALIGPTPHTSNSQGTAAATSVAISALRLAASASRAWMSWAVARRACTVARCSSDLAGRALSLAQERTCWTVGRDAVAGVPTRPLPVLSAASGLRTPAVTL